jgi:hypothetical protein
MSKKLKTSHQNYTWWVGTLDTYDWEAGPEKTSKQFDSEEKAVAAARNTANIQKGDSFYDVIVMCSSGSWYRV